MRNLELYDEIKLDLVYVKAILGQLQQNHCLEVKEEHLTKMGEYAYCRTYSWNNAMIDIVAEKVKHADHKIDELIEKDAG